jgi:hypothetical protein
VSTSTLQVVHAITATLALGDPVLSYRAWSLMAELTDRVPFENSCARGPPGCAVPSTMLVVPYTARLCGSANLLVVY